MKTAAAQQSRAERVLELIRRHRGPRAAITAAQIAEELFGDRGLDRQVRLLIEELVCGGEGEILASTGGGAAFPGAPAGYFWAENPQQIEAYANVLLSRMDEMKGRLHAIWAALKRLRGDPPDQLRIRFEQAMQHALDFGDTAPANPHRWGFDPQPGGRKR